MLIFVGLDCGGSTSRLLAVDESGEPIFEGHGGPANLLTTPLSIVEQSLREAAEGCPLADAACGAFAGLVGEDERRRALDLLQKTFPDASLRAEPDYAAAHAAAPPGTDVTVIAGTGSLVCGYDAHGKLAKTGGGGYLLADEGSGFRYGRAALAHFVHEPGARSPELVDAVYQIFGSREAAVVTTALYAVASPQNLLARLVPAFAADLDAGATYAQTGCEKESAELAAVVAKHIETHLFDRPFVRIALTGGVWNATDHLQRQFRSSLEERLPKRQIEIERTKRPPVQGAVALAKEQLIGNGN